MGRKTGFNDNYLQYLNSPEWREKANERLEIDNHTCCVCGEKATEVHHLTYDHFGNEQMNDLISLCHDCHQEAEKIYDPTETPYAMEEKKPEGNNFMAAMRVDAQNVSDIVFDYLVRVNGSDFDSLMRFRQPPKSGGKAWSVLKQAVKALCEKRYSMNCVADRSDMMIESISNHMVVVCLDKIEHTVRNNIQASLSDAIYGIYEGVGTWKKVEESTGLSSGVVTKIKNDDGTSFGPSLREEVLYYCGLDAAAGIRPIEGFTCLSQDDYATLNALADYMASISGNGKFKGEYIA